MSQELTLFVGMFTTLLAIINPLEALPVFLKLLEGKNDAEQRRVAGLSCFYALLLAFFFSSFLPICWAIVATMYVIYLFLASAEKGLGRIGRPRNRCRNPNCRFFRFDLWIRD